MSEAERPREVRRWLRYAQAGGDREALEYLKKLAQEEG